MLCMPNFIRHAKKVIDPLIFYDYITKKLSIRILIVKMNIK